MHPLKNLSEIRVAGDVYPRSVEVIPLRKTRTLSDLLPGEVGVVCGLNSAGEMGRRLQDIGLIRGTKVACLGRSPLGDPTAYRIRGATMALRGRDAQGVEVEGP